MCDEQVRGCGESLGVYGESLRVYERVIYKETRSRQLRVQRDHLSPKAPACDQYIVPQRDLGATMNVKMTRALVLVLEISLGFFAFGQVVDALSVRSSTGEY